MSKVIPCPYCGQPAIISTELSGGRPYGVCDNPDCGAYGLGATWNSRVYPAKVQAVLEAAEALTDTFTHEGFGRCWIALNTAVRDYKESKVKE